MLQVSVLRANPEEVKKKLAKKHFKQPELVDTIISLDDERKKINWILIPFKRVSMPLLKRSVN